MRRSDGRHQGFVPARRSRGAVWPLVMALVISACGSQPKPIPIRLERARPLVHKAYAHYLRGRLAIFEGDYPRAVREFRAASRVAPDESPIALALVDALHRSGDRAESRKLVEWAQKRWPRVPEVWMASGFVYRSAQDHRAALQSFQQASRLDPDDTAALLVAAREWLALGNPAKAEATYRELLRRHPDSAEAHAQLGFRLLERGKLQAAELHLSRALLLRSDHLKARVELARAQRALGKTWQSIETLRQAFDRSHGDPAVGEELFSLLLDAGEKDRAVALVGELDRDDLDLEERVMLGYLYLRVAAFEEAQRLAQRLSSSASVHGAVVELRARALLGLGRDADAIDSLLAVEPSAGGYVVCQALAVEILAESGEIERARAVLDDALRAFPDDVDLLIAQAQVDDLAGNAGRAREVLTRGLDANPGSPQIVFALAELENRHNRWSDAIAAVEPLLGKDPNNVAALNYIGFSLVERKIDLSRAETLLRRALELAPDSGFVLDSIGWLLFQKGAFAQARPHLERAARLAPAEPEILWHLAELYWQEQRRLEAESLFRKAAELAREPRLRGRIQARRDALRGPS